MTADRAPRRKRRGTFLATADLRVFGSDCADKSSRSKKTEKVAFRVSVAEKRALREWAREKGVSIADLVWSACQTAVRGEQSIAAQRLSTFSRKSARSREKDRRTKRGASARDRLENGRRENKDRERTRSRTLIDILSETTSVPPSSSGWSPSQSSSSTGQRDRVKEPGEVATSGIDKARASPRRGEECDSLPKRLGSFVRRKDHAVRERRSAYRRRSTYRDRDDPEAPMVDIFHQPRKPFIPAIQVEMRSKLPKLMDVGTVVRQFSRIEKELRCRLLVREIELTVDVPPSVMGDRELRHVASFPRVLNTIHWKRLRPDRISGSDRVKANDVMCESTSSVYGARNAARLFRIYRKNENGFSATRFEYRLRGKALAELGVTDVRSLRRVRWSDVLAAGFGVFQFEPPPRSKFQGVHAQVDADLIRVRGLHAALRNATAARRRFVEKYLTPHPIGPELIALARAALDPPRLRRKAN